MNLWFVLSHISISQNIYSILCSISTIYIVKNLFFHSFIQTFSPYISNSFMKYYTPSFYYYSPHQRELHGKFVFYWDRIQTRDCLAANFDAFRNEKYINKNDIVQDCSPPPSPRSLNGTLSSGTLTAEFMAFLHHLDTAERGGGSEEDEGEEGRTLTLKFVLDIR
jgi:hypothetical protein